VIAVVEGLQKARAGMLVKPVPAAATAVGRANHAAAFFIDRPVFAWVIALVLMLAALRCCGCPSCSAIAPPRWGSARAIRGVGAGAGHRGAGHPSSR
jgi:hypothetical protein